VTLEGTPQERGRTHGQVLKKQIHALVRRWKADLADRYGLTADAFIQKFVQQTDYLAAMKQWTPDLIEEIRGIAQGADLDFDTLFVLQLIDEYWVNGPGVAREHCSALGIRSRGDQPTIIAQTMDLEGFRNGFQVLLHIKHADRKREALLLSHAGLIGLTGMNNQSLGVCCNTVSQLAFARSGLPVACVIRGVLEQPTEEAALAFLRRVKHASGQNYIVGGPAKVHDLECSAGKKSRFVPDSGPDVVWHTNHPLVNDDYNPSYRTAVEKNETESWLANSTARLQSLQRRLGKDAAGGGLDLVRATLAAKDSAEHPVCRPYKNQKGFFSFASVILVLSPSPEMHVAPGPPDVQAYQRHGFHR
jgi:predicted choloylglycine hydrolase